jgi:(p)ppGpp synthase/HD superfamily hydrolase
MRSLPDVHLRALHFAARAHGDQKTLAGLPYVVHLTSVAIEVACALRAEPGRDEALAIECALLHDVVEDTRTPLSAIESDFGAAVARGVAALTKDASLPREQQMADSLRRIRGEPIEIAMVKLADRITNTASTAPGWGPDRAAAYRDEAGEILAALGHASAHLAARLRDRIAAYGSA